MLAYWLAVRYLVLHEHGVIDKGWYNIIIRVVLNNKDASTLASCEISSSTEQTARL